MQRREHRTLKSWYLFCISCPKKSINEFKFRTQARISSQPQLKLLHALAYWRKQML